MNITPFATEHFYERYEFSAPHLLSASDCETISVDELLHLAGMTLAALGATQLGYTETQGHPDLRAAIAALYADVNAKDVVVLSSPEEGIFLTLHALLEPGDEAIVLMPAYDSLRNLAEHVCGSVRLWKLQPTPAGWELDLAGLVDLINERTRLLVVNFPHNPTGHLPTREQFDTLLDIAKRHNLWLFCDEMYRGLEFDMRPQLPSAIERYERSVVLSGLSKTYGLPGLRSGCLLIRDPELRRAVQNWKFYTTICPPAPSEVLAQAALAARETIITRNRTRIRENLKRAQPFFERWQTFFEWRPPQAGSVALVGVDVSSATDYCHRLAQTAGVVLLPSSCMGFGDNHVRFGFGRDSFEEALGNYDTWLQKQGFAF